VNLLEFPNQARLAVFVMVFAALALAEWALPRRALIVTRTRRWLVHLAVLVLDSALTRVLLPLGLVSVAVFAGERGIGLLPWIGAPASVAAIVGFLTLDLAVYAQHVALHHWPAIWPLHMVHHADVDFDATTGVRFHPAEILLSTLWKSAIVLVVGVGPMTAFVFEIALNATSMFSHANLRLGTAADRWLRLVLVTPDMHRVHHSVHRHELNANFGFNLPWWDWLFSTYRAQPAAPHEVMRIGYEDAPDADRWGIGRFLAAPWKR
jgi:sterol desaturase/sphingolipid hydroxylase (fatty acid hydroxylase superfamily)